MTTSKSYIRYGEETIVPPDPPHQLFFLGSSEESVGGFSSLGAICLQLLAQLPYFPASKI